MKLSSIYYLHEIGGKKNQEDYIWPVAGAAVRDTKVFIICDGVGGSDNGEVASRMIAEYTGNRLLQTAAENISVDYINELLLQAKNELVEYAVSKGLNKDMATTFTLLYLASNKAFIAWCGDSRVYHIRKGNILYETSDHSLVNSLVKKGEITEKEALTHPQKHIILKAITGDDSTSLAEGQWINNIEDRDYFMLCTDGLLENLTDNDLQVLLGDDIIAHKDLALAIQEKCFGKTRDNYSMYLVQISIKEEPSAVKKAVRKYRGAWILILLLLLAAGIYFFISNNATVRYPPSIPAGVIAAPAKDSTIIKHDTILVPGAYADSELLNKEEPGTIKIVPAPLPESKPMSDTGNHKAILPGKTNDTAQLRQEKSVKRINTAKRKDTVDNQVRH